MLSGIGNNNHAAARKSISGPSNTELSYQKTLSDLSDSCSSFLNEFDNFINNRKHEIDAKLNTFKLERIEYKSKYESFARKSGFQAAIDDERISIGSKQKLEDNLNSKRKELDNLAAQESSINAQVDSMTVDIQDALLPKRNNLMDMAQALKVENERKRREISDKLHALDMKLSLLERKARIQDPALQFYQKMFAMRLIPIEAGRVRIVFTCIDEKDADKEFYFDLTTNNNVYSVVKCEPKLTNLDSLVSQVNATKDFHELLKQMRKAFVAFTKF